MKRIIIGFLFILFCHTAFAQTNEVISTYDSGGGKDYNSLSTWEEATDNLSDITTGVEQVTISNVSATRFDIGEALSFSSSGATATCYGTNLGRTQMYYVVLTGTPTTADTITGDTTTASADIDIIDSTSTGVSFTLECYSGVHTDNVTVAGITTTSSSYYRTIRPASGEGHSGIPDGSGVEFNSSVDDYMFFLDEDNARLENIVAKHTPNSATGYATVTLGKMNTYAISVLVYDSTNAGSGVQHGFKDAYDSGSHYYITCLAHNCEYDGFRFNTNAGNAYAYNCTSTYNIQYGFKQTAGTATVTNGCSSHNSAGDWNGTITTTTSTTEGQTPTYVNVGIDNFHLNSEDTVAKTGGTDLSGTFTVDVDGDTISAWMKGFDYVTGSNAFLPKLIYYH